MRISAATSLASIIMLGLAACSQAPEQVAEEPTPDSPTAAAVDAERLTGAAADGANWMSYGRTYDEQRHSPLTQINADNVNTLGLAWSFDLDSTRGVEATPLVIDGVMYTTSTWSIVYALDAKTGELLWKYDPEVPKAWGANACCDVVNRGVAAWEGKLFLGALDGRLIALDAKTGTEVWSVNTIDKTKPYTITGAPRVVKGKVLIGNGGAELGVRGYLSAYDAETGEMAWRFYTIPGNPADGFENDTMEMAAETWNGEWWAHGGGGTAWDAMAYDPDLDLLYIGVGNGTPWNRELRSPGGGDNLFLSSVVALRPDTGDYVWHYQTTPGESWDYTATQHIILADLTIEGAERKVLMQAPKNGFFYVIDRVTGEFISAEAYVPLNWATHVDPETGRPVEVPEARYVEEGFTAFPGPLGGHNWHPMSFNPDTGLVYIPALDMPSMYAQDEAFGENSGFWNIGRSPLYAVLPDDFDEREAIKLLVKGHLAAWDPVAQKEVWRVQHAGAWNGGTLTTAGNLVFQGTANSRIVAYRADTGDELWSTEAQTGVVAAPMTYAIDGEQYVAINAGWGGAFALAAGFFVAPESATKTNRILTFKLGADGQLPPLDILPLEWPEAPEQAGTPEQIALGKDTFAQHCQYCHGDSVVSGGLIPDLRFSALLGQEDWQDVVIGGALVEAGMISFGEIIDAEQAENIRVYVIERLIIDKAEAAERHSEN
jgi:quinohemoprotein ethanol dehydrogenase